MAKPEKGSAEKHDAAVQQVDDDEDESGLADALGLIGTVGAVFSYLLVYAFRLGEAMRYGFDPSIITVSINDFLTVLIPIALCLVYLLAVSLLIRDLEQSARGERKRRRVGSGSAARPRERALPAAATAVLYAAPFAACAVLSNGGQAPWFSAAASLCALVLTVACFARMDRARPAQSKATVDHPKHLRICPSRPQQLFATLSLTLLPVWLTLLASGTQSSMWISLVIGALLALLTMCLVMRYVLHLSPVSWAYGIARRGTRGLVGTPVRTAPIIGGAFAAVLALFLLAGYTNQLDFTGSHTLLLEDPQSGTDYAVLALFDGNRAVVRTADPVTPAPADGAAPASEAREGSAASTPDDVANTTFSITMDEPYRVVYLTDGYDVLQAGGIEIRE